MGSSSRLRRTMWMVLLGLPEAMLALVLACLIASITIVVFSRYVLNLGIGWSDEAARILFLWIVFFGFALSVRYRRNVAVDWLVDRLPGRMRRVVGLFQDAAILAFSLFFALQTGVLVRFSFMQTLASLEISMAWVYIPILVAGSLMTLFAIFNLWDRIQGKVQLEPAEDDPSGTSTGTHP